MPRARKTSTTLDRTRKQPVQARAVETRAAIVEAAAQILFRDGEDALTTNRIAERAGVSVGSIYQYFDGKSAIVSALIERERQAMAARIGKELEGVGTEDVAVVTRRIIRAVIEAFRARRGARKLLLEMTLKRFEEGGGKGIAAVAAFIAAAAENNRVEGARPPTPVRIYVLTRAIANTIRGAALENSRLLDDPEFEEELVSLALAYLRG